MSHPTIPFTTQWTEFSLMTIPSRQRNAKVISKARKSYIKGRTEKDIRIISKIHFWCIIDNLTIYVSIAYAIYFSSFFFFFN